jgi:hypothetical protein
MIIASTAGGMVLMVLLVLLVRCICLKCKKTPVRNIRPRGPPSCTCYGGKTYIFVQETKTEYGNYVVICVFTFNPIHFFYDFELIIVKNPFFIG